MKHELPLAGLMLAVICLLIVWSLGIPTEPPVVASQPALTPPQQQDPQSKPANPLRDEQRQQSQQQQLTRRQLQSIELDSPESGTTEASWQMSAYLHPASDPRTIELLATIARQTAQSPPLGASLHLTARLFDQAIHAKGRYFQAGQGSHKNRLELNFGGPGPGPSVFQMCDGRFVYRLETIGHQQTFEFVDLQRIQLQSGEHPSEFSPTGWIATGGLSSLVQHLGSAFNFSAPMTIEGQPITDLTTAELNQPIVIRGSWNESALRQLLHGTHPEIFAKSPTSTASLGNSVDWDRIPPQLPHAIEIYFVPSQLTGMFPARVSFMQFQTAPGKEHTRRAMPVVNIAFSDPQPLQQVNDQMFVIDTTDIESIDSTDHYLARIQSIEDARLAESSTNESR